MDQAKKLRELMEKDNPILKEEEPKGGDITNKARIVSISSGKGGVGKSNFSINFALSLIKKGYKVAIIDADVGLGNIEILLGIEVKNTISDLIVGDKEITEILGEGPLGLKVISGGKGLQELDNMTEENIAKVLEGIGQLENLVDFILIDTGAGISQVVIDFILASEEVVVITTPDPTSIMDSYILVKTLNLKAYRGKVNLVSNMVDSSKEGKITYKKISRAASNFLSMETNYLGYISKDDRVNKSVRNQIPFNIGYPTSKIVKEIEHIIDNFLWVNTFVEKESFSDKLFKIFKKRWQYG